MIDKLEQVDKMIFEDSVSASNYYTEIKDYKEEYNLVLQKNTMQLSRDLSKFTHLSSPIYECFVNCFAAKVKYAQFSPV